jgi:hypothetical protein
MAANIYQVSCDEIISSVICSCNKNASTGQYDIAIGGTIFCLGCAVGSYCSPESVTEEAWNASWPNMPSTWEGFCPSEAGVTAHAIVWCIPTATGSK